MHSVNKTVKYELDEESRGNNYYLKFGSNILLRNIKAVNKSTAHQTPFSCPQSKPNHGCQGVGYPSS